LIKLSRLLRAFAGPELQVESFEVLAGMQKDYGPQRSQFSHLVRHFLARFFNHETASTDGDAKTRFVTVAFAASMPGFVFALYMWHPYHPMIGPLPPYWTQAGDHFFYVIYSYVTMGVVTVFEWDLFFPDLLDVFVLSTLPIMARRLLVARISAIAILVFGFLFDANLLATLALPSAIDPPDIWRFMGGHLLAVGMSGLFGAVSVLALQAVLIALLGERFFRRVSLFLQGLLIALLLMPLFLLPVVAGVIEPSMTSGYAIYFPPFWFLGIYQRLMDGPAALPIYSRLAQVACLATLSTACITIVFYPLAYWRRIKQLIEGAGTHDTRSWAAAPFNQVLHATVLRSPARRAIFHFISQTLMRVHRYRIYLVMYGGLGLSVVVACLLRLNLQHEHVRVAVSAEGMRIATPMIAFWTIAGLRMAIVSPGNQRGSWVFRVIQGTPGMDQLLAAKIWVLGWALAITLGSYAAMRNFAPRELLGPGSTASQLIVAIGFCVLLTDMFFLYVKIIPFTGEQSGRRSELAGVLLKYYSFVPLVVLPPLWFEPWMEGSGLRMALAVLLIAGMHLRMRAVHRRVVRENLSLAELYGDEDEFPLRLGLRG
jgi:hypothetical protein